MISAFGVDHGDIEKSWSKAGPKVSRASLNLSEQRNPDMRKVTWLSNRKYLASQKKKLEAGSPANRAKTEMKVLGTGGTRQDGADAVIGMPPRSRAKSSRKRLP